MSRLAGKAIRLQIDEFALRMSNLNVKEEVMDKFHHQMRHECPSCIGCGEVEFHEQQDHVRMTRLYAVTCKRPLRYTGDKLNCPDGFFGIYDANAKEVRELKLELPTTMMSFDEFSGGVSKISAGLASFGPGSTTGYTRADARLNPNVFNTDRPAGIKAAPKPRNKDVPMTADDVW